MNPSGGAWRAQPGQCFQSAPPYVLAVEHLAGGVLLGHVGFSPLDSEVKISYAIAEHARRRGYGSEALLYACQWAAASFDLPSILAITESENDPSRRTSNEPRSCRTPANAGSSRSR